MADRKFKVHKTEEELHFDLTQAYGFSQTGGGNGHARGWRGESGALKHRLRSSF